MAEQVDLTTPRKGNSHGIVLDDTAQRIIEQLQEDGRRSYAAIGKAVGLSEAAVRQRVQRLLETGVVQVVGVTDPVMLGFSRQAMIGIRCDGDPSLVADEVAELQGVEHVVITAGSFDLLVEVVASNDERLLDLLRDIRSVAMVTGTESFLYLRLHKHGRRTR
ncbi:Lrp/AsnC family transcriptional regulator [Salinactinospora qingdaonensis]|uniref:Lrp/AsnC family transcriptional regulator n=1 Tax=Salinactinospora qingdaonensis TaxID=702744 RepID=A0ABP7FQK4_9ACTN